MKWTRPSMRIPIITFQWFKIMGVLRWTLVSLAPSLHFKNSVWVYAKSIEEGANDVNIHWRTPIIWKYWNTIFGIIYRFYGFSTQPDMEITICIWNDLKTFIRSQCALFVCKILQARDFNRQQSREKCCSNMNVDMQAAKMQNVVNWRE